MTSGRHSLAGSQSRRRRLAVWMSQRAETSGPAGPMGAFSPEQLRLPTARVVAKVLADPSPLTWLFTGDSLVPQDASFPVGGGTLISHLMGIIRDLGGRHQDSVVSTVQPGCRLGTLLEQYESRVARFRPDCVVISCHHPELEDISQHYERLEQATRGLTELNRHQGSLTVLNLPIHGTCNSFEASVERLVRLEALRGSALEAGALVIDHWTDWETHAATDWYLPCGRLPSQRGLARMARMCALGMGLPCDPANDISLADKSSMPPLLPSV